MILSMVRCVPVVGKVQMVLDWLSWALDVWHVRHRVQQGHFGAVHTKGHRPAMFKYLRVLRSIYVGVRGI